MNLKLEELYLNPNIFIAESDVHRWGVFTDDEISAFDVIQDAPYATFDNEEIENSPTLERYSYASDGGSNVKDAVMGFGFAAMYNHSTEPNVAYVLDTANEVMRHYALRDIEAGEELVVDYGCGDDDDWGDY